MTNKQRHLFALATASTLCLAAALHPATADDRLPVIEIASLDDDQFVIANMAATLESFGLGQEQAWMLAEQTAEFGTEGLMTTVAAIGIGAEQAEMIAEQQEGLNGGLWDQSLAITVQTR